MNTFKISTISTALLFGSALLALQANAEGRLTVYCSAQNVVCEKAVQGFEKNMM